MTCEKKDTCVGFSGECEGVIGYMDKCFKVKNRCGDDNCNNINSGIDKCIQPIIEALNAAGMETIASCCGHGNSLGTIALFDGREIMIIPDFETARKVESIFPDIHGRVPRMNVVDNTNYIKEMGLETDFPT